MSPRRMWLLAFAAGFVILLAFPTDHAHAQGNLPAPWNVPWNAPGAAVPLAPASSPPSYCTQASRQPETAEDSQVVATGWWLSSSYVSNGSITVVIASSDFGGMCQPSNNQGFVFIDGIFAGALAPFVTGPAEGTPLVKVDGPNFIWATFTLLQAGDLFCCPSRLLGVSYSIDRSSGLPVLVATGINTMTVTYNQ